MPSCFKKHLLLIWVISASGTLFAMENQDKQSPPAAKIRKLDQSSACISTGQPAIHPEMPTPVSDVSQRPQCPSVRRFDRPSKERSPERQDLQRDTKRRRALNFGDSTPVPQTESAVTPPAEKCLRADAPQVVQDEPVDQVLTSQYILPNILQFLDGPDFCRFACVSKSCAAATQAKLMCENTVANALQKKVSNPINYVLGKAKGEENVRVCGLLCNTCALVTLLREKASLLDESIGAYIPTYDQYLKPADRAKTPLPEALTNLSSEELFALKPVKYIEISDNEITEDQLVEYVKEIAEQFPDHTIFLNLSRSHGNAHGRIITESLIDKLAQYPIISLHCQQQEFPRGLACLSVLHALRSLTIIECDIAGNAIPDELCQGLPFLTILQVAKSAITSVSPLIEKLEHLAVLDLYGNNITKLPDALPNPHLKTLNVIQLESMPSAQLSDFLQSVHTLKNLSLSYRDRRDPLKTASDDYLAQLELLVLRGNIGTLRWHYNQLRNLKILGIFLAENHAQLPLCISGLPALQLLTGKLEAGTIIAYETLLFIARQLRACSIFSTTDNMPAIKVIVNLWQFIQMNHELISTKLKELDDSQRFNYQQFLDITQLFMNTKLEASILKNFVADPNKCATCFEFLRNIVLAQYQPMDGSQEALVVSNQFRPHDESFARTIAIIAKTMCQNIPVYSFVGSSTKATAANQCFVDQLNSIATAINKIMEMIEQGSAISENQFKSCITQLNLPVNNNQYIKGCTFILANLFFHHAIAHNDITNATFMRKLGSQLIETINTWRPL